MWTVRHSGKEMLLGSEYKAMPFAEMGMCGEAKKLKGRVSAFEEFMS